MWKALDGSTKITVLCSHKNTEYHCVTGWTNQFCLKCENIKRYATTDSGMQKFLTFEMVLRAYVLIINSCCSQALFIVVIKQKCNLLISVSHKPLSMVCMCIFRNRYQKIGAIEKLGTYHLTGHKNQHPNQVCIYLMCLLEIKWKISRKWNVAMIATMADPTIICRNRTTGTDPIAQQQRSKWHIELHLDRAILLERNIHKQKACFFPSFGIDFIKATFDFWLFPT